MRGILIGISEAVQGQIHQLEEAEILLGRASRCAVRVEHSSVSREHCLIRVCEEHAEIHDRSSRNGTFINGLPVRDRALVDGDEIMIGDVVFLFRTLTPGVVVPSNQDAGEPSLSDTGYALNAPLVREAASLARLGEVVRVISQCYPDLEADSHSGAAQLLFSSIFEIIPSRRGALLMFAKAPDPPRLFAGFDVGSPTGTVEVPESVIHQLSKSRAPASGNLNKIAWLASPILCSGRMMGALYLDSGSTRRDYERRDLQMVSALADILALAIETARDVQLLKLENGLLKAEMPPDNPLVGDSPAMCALHNMILRVARSDATVLISGESGTGKELVARAIHRNSRRGDRPFVAVNCAAIAETLLESEFFGHEKGAFTGAVAQRKGRFEMANEGTVFLDEIGELAHPLQAKLLRVLQEQEFERVGGSRTVKLNVRVIAATNRDLPKAVSNGSFREDLFYRLNVVPIRIPPLRDRRDDILRLAAHFLGRYSSQAGRTVTGFSREARAMLATYEWPGNVRELQNVIERAVVMGSAEVITADDLPDVLLDAAISTDPADDSFHASVRQHRRRVIVAALERADGNVAEAARALKLHPVYLHRLITSLGLRT
jgi:transcriptional regulator with GAF, ATPase, and Fis domain